MLQVASLQAELRAARGEARLACERAEEAMAQLDEERRRANAAALLAGQVGTSGSGDDF